MRLHVLSDLHLELGPGTAVANARARGIAVPEVGADAVVLAGDTANAADGVRWAALIWPDRPVIYVLGNHEHYGWAVDATVRACRAAARGTSVRVLENETAELAGVRILGATLWTDFRLHGAPRASAEAATRWMADFSVIRNRHGRTLSPCDTIACHRRTRAWLARELGATDATTVVVTHHAPHPQSDRFGDLASAAFVSDLGALIERFRPSLWVHGHTHACNDYRVGATRVVSNQAGYPHEETNWDPGFCIDLPG